MHKKGVIARSKRVNPYYRSAHWKALRHACIWRDKGRCTVPGCNEPGTVVDHIVTRPHLPCATEADRLGNVRLMCKRHDDQVKEDRSGKRKSGGKPFVIGSDASGQPKDPLHPWNRRS